MAARAITALTVLLAARAQHLDPIYDLTEEQYYEMPQLFALDEWAGCRARAGAYCVGTFELVPEAQPHPLFDTMKRYSANWVDNFNHTRLHRGTCLPRSCAAHAPPPQARDEHTVEWFTTCINASTSAEYNLSAYLYKLDYCEVGAAQPQPLTLNQRAFAGFVVLVLVLVTIATVLDITLADHVKKEYEWAVSFSLGGSWRVLHAPPPSAARTDLTCFDGLRVFIMMVVIVEHVTWITTHAYISDTRTYEQLRRAPDAVLLSNSTLVVQIFFMMSSFLLAHKLLQQGRKGDKVPIVSTFIDTIVNRFIRVSPSYFVVVWFAGSWWERLGAGPLWAPLVRHEAAACRRKWWPHLLYLHNVVYPDDKCLIQTWYLAADMQLYALCLALTLALARWRRAAVLLVGALLLGSVAALFALAYVWRLVPTLVMHRPESVRVSYDQDLSFNVLYQSPLGNLPGALGGLLLAHLHHALLDHNVNLTEYPVFCWSSVLSVPAAAWWVLCSPRLAGRGGPPARLQAAALAALERPVFSILIGCAVLGAMNGVPSAVRRVFSWRGWAAWARLSFGALLLHMPLNKALVAARRTPSLLDRQTAIVEWFGVAAVSYLAALVLALLVELPAQRLHRALTRPRPSPAPPAPPPTDKTDL